MLQSQSLVSGWVCISQRMPRGMEMNSNLLCSFYSSGLRGNTRMFLILDVIETVSVEITLVPSEYSLVLLLVTKT